MKSWCDFSENFLNSLLLFTLMATSCFACHNFQPLHYNNHAHAARGVSIATNSPPPPPLDYFSMDKCFSMYPPYNAEELVATSMLYPFSDELAVTAGGRLTCAFDDPNEYCSWHNAMTADFTKAEWNTLFDINRFECTHPRRFPSSGQFLLVKGDPSGHPRTAALETTVPCQDNPGIIKFDVWSNNGNPGLRYCLNFFNNTSYCEDAMDAPNPLSFTVPYSVDPFTIRIEVTNINSQDVILIDNLYYEGRICEEVDDDESSSTAEENSSSKAVSEVNNLKEKQNHLVNGQVARDAFAGGAELEPIGEAMTFDIASNSEPEQLPPIAIQETVGQSDQNGKLNSTEERAADLLACEELACDFNHNHSCFYKLDGFGSTSSWQVGSGFVGNRHTGIQRPNPFDYSNMGYVYVGKNHVDSSNEIFVMESPKFQISSDARLTFDVYLRSHSPKLKVCIDSFDNCPYQSPPISKLTFWHTNHAINLGKGVRKVYFIATAVRQNQFLGVDRIRVIMLDGSSCA
ncbi:hypothetical protein V3C99_015287 [Haemonchus contortus]